MKFFWIAILFIFGVQSSQAALTPVEYFAYKFRATQNQKDWIQSLGISDQEKADIFSFFKSQKFENTPLPKIKPDSATLLFDGQHPLRIDFSKSEEGLVKIGEQTIDTKKNLSLKEIYQQIKTKKSATHRSLFLSEAYAEGKDEHSIYGTVLAWTFHILWPGAPNKRFSESTWNYLLTGLKPEMPTGIQCPANAEAPLIFETQTGNKKTTYRIVKGEKSSERIMESNQPSDKCSTPLHLHFSRIPCGKSTLCTAGPAPVNTPLNYWKCSTSTKNDLPVMDHYFATVVHCCGNKYCASEFKKRLALSTNQQTTAPANTAPGAH